ncbi:hypothetical protein Tco_1284094 [Tanacetum coccineum]
MSAIKEENSPPPPLHHHSKQLTLTNFIKVSTSSCLFSKGEYDIWAMENGALFGPYRLSNLGEEIVARERERKARTALLMALPEDHLAKFHKMTDAKEMWDAIKLDMVDNDESLPSAWSQVSLIMRTKPGVDTLSFDDLYNNLRVFESDIKGSTASSSSSSQNVAFVLDTQTLSSMDHVGFEQSDDMTLKINGLEMASACLNENEKVLQKNAQTQTQRYDGILSYKNEVLQSVFMNMDSDKEDNTLYDRFVTSDGMHAVPPPMTGNYMPSGPNVEIDDSKFTYGPKLPITSESETNTSDFSSCESESSVESLECLPKQVC